VRITGYDKPAVPIRRNIGVRLLLPAFAIFFALSGVAAAQSGGITGPGGTTPPGDPAPSPTPSPTSGAPSGKTQVFPVKGRHTYGDGWGAARSGHTHQGMDIFAACGTPEVAVMNGVIVNSAFQGSAGNYQVLRNKKVHRDYVYMHMRKPGLPKGTKVTMGQWVGAVGETGNASGCHLHFEIWRGKWYRGGRPFDPEPSLRAWDAYS
jgi:murein DD-endopeptidase MepM/ murein hydrolase activator NlpD